MKKRAFTLVELLVVIAIIAVLAALMFPVFANTRKSAKITDARSRLHQTMVAINLYRPDFDDSMPATLKNLIGYGKPSITKDILTCPISGREFFYPFNYHLIQQTGTLKDIAPEFEPSRDSAIKAMYIHRFDCGSANTKCDVRTFENPTTRQTFTYTTPKNASPESYLVLAGFLDGHVDYVPALEKWELAHIKQK